ncbi:MAG: hypothetical protein GY811_09715 [Myxococcales bacterium]|nr:hypothetical protein [Myxococcales bacterium]
MQSNSKGIERERRNHFRGRSQAGRRVDVLYRRADGEATAAGPLECTTVTANIGVGGSFVLTEFPESVGTALEVCIQVPEQDHELILRADVRWTCASSPIQAAGMGLQFESLEVAALLLLHDYFSTLGPAC